jgi:hypothetical protein
MYRFWLKVKVKVTLEQAMKAQTWREQKYRSIFCFSLGARWVGWRTPRPGGFTLEIRPGTHCTWGWVGPKGVPDCCGKIRSHQDSISRQSSP